MGILLSWKLIIASILCLTSLASSSDPQQDKPLPIKISSVKFESVCVNIYDSQTTSNNKKIYFYSPLALLIHTNVASINNQTSTHGTLSVLFRIWNEEVKKKVVEQLNQQFPSQTIEPSQVQVFPFDSVRLTSKVQSADFSLTNEWLPYKIQQTQIRFTLICPTKEDCSRVKTQMLNFPEQFEEMFKRSTSITERHSFRTQQGGLQT
jgi:hypothetical protein